MNCSVCNKEYLKDNRHINENIKLGHKFYCSFSCQSIGKNKKIELTCNNPVCINRFVRIPTHVSPYNFCSRSCTAIVNNFKFPKRVAVVRKCCFCNNEFVKGKKYCSVQCKSNALTISREKVIEIIKEFYKKYGRIPVKREMWGIYKPARKYFETWNNAIEAAGFDPNPVMFANHHLANDGHICDSLAEKLIDDYLFEKDISHERNIPYPEGTYTADFKIGNKLIEYFGLAGEHRRYDELRIIKQRIVKRLKLELIEIYPKDLYPTNKLDNILSS
ncbi:MAG: hypothetical protein Q8O68_00315 [Candidatus Daviesbacteria bacterium]|nr:hypothetical protein [Candidatus Daviesbacteria bacterium]